jgi:3-oxoacyl-[acyl-carrier protein] reductase
MQVSISSLIICMLSGILMMSRIHAYHSCFAKPARSFGSRISMARNKEAPSNPVVVVTGASRGIGRAIALALGDAGCKVVINYAANSASADAVVNEILQRSGDKGAQAIALRANCGNPDEVNTMFSQVAEKFGPVDILVNNAGITRDMLAMMMKPKDFTDVIDLNLNGVFYCSQAAFTTSMMRQKRGRIVNIASIVGQIGNPGQANYAAAKGGVLGMTKALAKELGGRGITVNAVCPGFIDSDMTKELNKENILPLIPLKRFGTPEEVAGLVKFLALDPAAGYITGHSFNVDGGLAIGAT